MLVWLLNMLIGQYCRHEWEILKSGKNTMCGEVIGNWYDLQCKKCGMVKGKNT